MSNEETKPDEPWIARYKPYYFKLVSGKSYFWCSCGRSQKQPFCDGSHKGTSFQPLTYRADSDDEVLFCGCKNARCAPFCDGTHNNLRDTYAEDDPESEANRNIPAAIHRMDGRLHLNGRCYVARSDELPVNEIENISWSRVIDEEMGAHFQSQFYFRVRAGGSPTIAFDDRDVVMLIVSGQGSIEIAGRHFDLQAETAFYVRPNETFILDSMGEEPLCVYISVCPQAAAPEFPASRGRFFDDACPLRSVTMGASEQHKMGDRSFQLLVDKSIGSEQVTQFVGNIPLSKAEMHRHLYEEALIILSGEGCLWTEDIKGDVRADDVIFLPAKQPHSLQCTHPDGMLVAGVIYPGGNPDINF